MTTEATAAEFREWFPEPAFPGIEDDAITRAIDEAQQLHSHNPLATLYLAAHLLATDTEQKPRPDAGAGVVTSEQIGPMRRNFLTQAGDDERRAFYVTTAYGRRFLALEDRNPRSRIGARVVGR